MAAAWRVGGAALLESEVAPGLLRRAARRPTALQIHGGGAPVRLPLKGTVVLSRTALDRGLLVVARGCGVGLRTGWVATLGPIEGDRRLVFLRRGDERRTLAASLVLGATGLAPLPVAEGVDFPRPRVREGSRIGVGAVFPAGTWDGLPDSEVEAVKMFVGAAGYVGVARLEDGTVDVAGALEPHAVRDAGGIPAAVATLLRAAGAELPDLDPIHPWRGTPALTRSTDPPGAERVLLIGDAAGYLEPFTGEGMSWAIEQAIAASAAASAVVRDGWTSSTLDAWARRRRSTVGPRLLIRTVSWLTRGPVRRRTALAILRRVPALARPLIRHAAGAPRRGAAHPQEGPA